MTEKTTILYHDVESGHALVYREMTEKELKSHPKYELAKKICQETQVIKLKKD